ncbi:hypothetical protein QM787_24690 [Rhodococcus ruber]|uniref:Uncharacterized protein n=1 Tax=Rhodococcus ruber TaxID=1830 RepID=A0A098BHI0_9NOCA|nr:hypothetical protein [Rhodococcus ruber]MCD2129638.1 hypothetical protein [Rhodococcus ruber]MCZ4506140.1 hypothetical protein [Rhodococcus ruber]MCZ4533241.1 hypothetical protein [Rhodococcus ruber]MCZ4623684.1 hypothetical protein [Rhodococcus ruber]MDI9970779.1 hypothetical protein [Rhodococcus ruber]
MSSTSFRKNWLSDREFEFRQRLEKASLVVEINLDENELRDLQGMYGAEAAEMLRRGSVPNDVIRAYPALTLAILVGQACVGYEQHRYWDEFFLQLDLERDQVFEQALRRSLRDLLRKFRLRDFPELKNEYVQLMALHSGFPVYCLRDVVDLLEDRMVGGTEMTGAAVIEWLLQPGKKHRMNDLDVPVRNFIQYGGQLAIDILNRMIEFLIFTASTDGWAAADIDLETSTTGLPTILLDRLIELVEERPFGSGPRPVVPHRRRMRKPTIAFLPLDRQIVVEVPYPDVEPDVPWRLSFDGDTRPVLAEPGWGVRPGEEHPPTPVPVPAPVREILLQHTPSAATAQVAVVDKTDPLLVFDLDGRWIPRHTTLPRGCVFAVHPSDAQVVDVGTGRTLTPLAPAETVTGWRGWVVAELDLSTSGSIALERGGTRPPGAVRTVRDPATPTFEHGAAVAGLTTLNGLTVYGSRPEVTLPANPGVQDIAWRVRVKRPDSPTWLIDAEIRGADEDLVVDPFEEFDDAVLGLFDIRVSGPVGTDLRQQAFYAEGISVEYGVPFRFPVGGGLKPVTATVHSEWDLTVAPPRIDFAAGERDKQVTVARPGRTYRLRLTPPYVQMRVDPVGAPAQWRTSAAVLTPAELDEDRIVAVHTPGAAAAVFHLEDPNGRLLKDVTPDAPHYDYFQASSRVFVDAARNAGRCRIVALVDDEAGRTTKIVLSHVRPAALCAGIGIDGGDLVLEDPADEQDLALNVWARTAPWRPVQTLTVSASRARLPERYVGAGPLLVQVFVDDPWVTITPPSWPDESAIEVTQPGWMPDESRERDNLARFLAGEGPAPSDAVRMPEVWSALALLPQDAHDVHTQRTRSALSRILKENPRAALEALGNSTIPLPDMMSLYIRTGLVFKSYGADYTLNDLHHDPWVGCMVEIADLPSLFARRTYVAEERAETLDYLEDKGGAALMEVLRHGKSMSLYEGVFDKDTVLFDTLPKAQVESIIAAARFVPGALLDTDTRVSAVIDAFHARREWLTDGWSSAFGSATVRSLDIVRRTRGLIHREVAARNEKLDGVDTSAHKWMLLPLQSLTLAVLARLDAHRMLRHAPVTSDFQEAWARMAQLCPRLVMTDLLIAEALVTHACHGDLIGEEA